MLVEEILHTDAYKALTKLKCHHMHFGSGSSLVFDFGEKPLSHVWLRSCDWFMIHKTLGVEDSNGVDRSGETHWFDTPQKFEITVSDNQSLNLFFGMYVAINCSFEAKQYPDETLMLSLAAPHVRYVGLRKDIQLVFANDDGVFP